MHLGFNRLFLTYQASDFNNWEKWEIVLYVFIILNGRFSFKFNFIPGWNSTRFIPGWNSCVNRNFFILGRVSSWDEIWSRLYVNALLVFKLLAFRFLICGWVEQLSSSKRACLYFVLNFRFSSLVLIQMSISGAPNDMVNNWNFQRILVFQIASNK